MYLGVRKGAGSAASLFLQATLALTLFPGIRRAAAAAATQEPGREPSWEGGEEQVEADGPWIMTVVSSTQRCCPN